MKKRFYLMIVLLSMAAQWGWAQKDISQAIIYNPFRFTPYSGGNLAPLYSYVEVYVYDNGWKKLTGPVYNTSTGDLDAEGADYSISFKQYMPEEIDEDLTIEMDYEVDRVIDKGKYGIVITGQGDYSGEAIQSLYVTEGGDWIENKAATFSNIDSDNHVITIENEAEMARLAWCFNYNYSNNSYKGWTFRLARNLDLSAHAWIPIGSKTPGDETDFVGHFDGQGHTIQGVYFDRGNSAADGSGGVYYPQGLFANICNIGRTGSVKNLTISDSEFVSRYNLGVGAVVGYLNSGSTVENCHVMSSVNVICQGGQNNESSGNSYGGVVGHCQDGNIRGCTSAAHVFMNGADNCRAFGGIVGCCDISWSDSYGELTNCIYYGDHVSATGEAGAIVGRLNNSRNKSIHCYYTSAMLRGCNGTDPSGMTQVESFAEADVIRADYGADEPTAEYPYDGIKVYPNIMVYDENFYAKAEYVFTHYERGDINKDGAFTIDDVSALVNIVLGVTKDYDMSVADVNNDGVIDIADVSDLVNIILNNKS